MNAFLWAVLTACIWGVVPLMEKVGIGNNAPTTAVVVRTFGVMAGLVVWSLIYSPWAAVRAMSWTSVVLLAFGGLLASFVGQMAFYQALKTGAISQVTPVAGTYPLIAAVLGWFVLREPLTLTRLLGVACVVVGIVLLRT